MDPDQGPRAVAAAQAASRRVPEGRLARLMRIDLSPAHRGPAPARWVMAAVASLAGSFLADEALIHICTALRPATAGFSHFRPLDFATLTAVGVVAACVGWPVVTRISAAPRSAYLRLAVVVTVVLWLPDGWLLVDGDSGAGVATLMLMHLAVAAVTYTCMVRLAPVRPSVAGVGAASGAGDGATGLSPRTVRLAWDVMAALVGLELVVGVVTIVTTPFHRPDALVPAKGAALYTVHGALGLVVGIGALGCLAVASRVDKMARAGAITGAVGVALGGIGGVAAVFQHLRVGGMVLMLVGAVVAGFGYLMPALEAFGEAERARATMAAGPGAGDREPAIGTDGRQQSPGSAV